MLELVHAATRPLRVPWLAGCLLVGCGRAAPLEDEATARAEPTVPSPVVPEPSADALERAGLEALRPERRFRWPLESVHITSRFGWRLDPVAGAGVRLHRGVDLRGRTGDLVTSIGAGRVRVSAWDDVLGEHIVVDHGDGIESLYAHLSARLVPEGLELDRGVAIGSVGNSGRSAAPHLHLTLRVDGLAVDPLEWIDVDARLDSLTGRPAAPAMPQMPADDADGIGAPDSQLEGLTPTGAVPTDEGAPQDG